MFIVFNRRSYLGEDKQQRVTKQPHAVNTDLRLLKKGHCIIGALCSSHYATYKHIKTLKTGCIIVDSASQTALLFGKLKLENDMA